MTIHGFFTVGTQTKFSLFRRIRIACICVIGLLLLALVEPHSFRTLVREGVAFQAARHGLHLEIGAVEGSLFEPVVFRDVWLASSRAAVLSKVSVRTAQVGQAEVGIDLGRCERCVAEQLLNCAEIAAALEHVRGVGMT